MWRRSAGMAALLACLAATAAESIGNVHADDPRPFGRFIGDILERRVTFDVADSAEVLAPVGANESRRAGPWVTLLDSRVRSTGLPRGRRYELLLRYQIINSPPRPVLITVPGTDLRVRSSGEIRTEHVPDWLLSLGPLTGPDVREGLEARRPSRLPPLMDARTPAVLAASWSGVGLLLAAWLGFERWGGAWFRSRRGPFARAHAGLRRLSREPQDAERERRALRLLHRAFDETAGRRVFAEGLDAFLAEHARFAAQRAGIEAFYDTSRAEFFGHGSATAVSLPALLRLSEQLRLSERLPWDEPGSVARAAAV